MIVWLWTNVALTTLALTFTLFNANAPHRLRFLVGFIALCGWLIPWQQIGTLIPTPVLRDLLPGATVLETGRDFTLTHGAVTSQSMTAALVGNANLIFLVSTMVGAVLFALSSVRHALLVKRMSLRSIAGGQLWAHALMESDHWPGKRPELRIQRRVPGAMTTGIHMPTIWIHEDLVQHPGLRAALVHECRHVMNHDNAYLWIIALVESLLWWNPLVRYLAVRTRQLQELSCDEACANDLSNYRDMLKQLVLTLSGNVRPPCAQSSYVYHSKNFNVHRIRALERRYAMRTKHYVGTGFVLISSLFVLGWAAAQNSPERIPVPEEAPRPTSPDEALQLIEERTGEDVGPIPGFEPGTTIEEAEQIFRGLRLYTVLLERQYDAQEAEIESLRRELEALSGPDLVDTTGEASASDRAR